MKKIFAALLIAASSLLAFAPPVTAKAAPTSWDFASGVLQPLQSAWSAVVKGSYFTATSTTATSTFPVASSTKQCIGNDCFTDITGTALTISGNALNVDTTVVTPTTRTITIAGTANQITSSAGAQDLSSNKTWTLSLPSLVNFPLAFTASYGTTTYASSTALSATNANFNLASSSLASTSVSTINTLYLNGLAAGAAYIGADKRLQSVATSAPSVSAPITYSGTLGSFIGGAAGSFGCTSASSGVTGCLTGTDWNTFNNKQAAISVTFPITLSGATVGFGGLSTSTAAVQGNIPYFSGVNTFANVATTTLVAGTNVSFSGGTPVIIGSSPVTINATGGGGGSGNVSTSTNETSGTLAYWTSNSATPALLGKVATSTFTISGPFSVPSTLGTLVGGSATTIGYYGLATTTQPSSSNLLVSNGAAGVYGAATTTLSISGPFSTSGTVNILGASPITSTYYGLSTTSAISQGQVLYGTSASGVASVATSAPSLPSYITYSGTLGAFVGGAAGTFGISQLPIANGGTNATSFTTSGNAVYYNGTALVTAPTNSAITIPFASSTAISATNANFTLASSTYASSTVATTNTLYIGGPSAGDLYLGADKRVQTAATTTVSCSGSVSCTSFTTTGSSPITITGTGGSSSGSTAWATTSAGSIILQYPSDTSAWLLFGGSSTSTADFVFDTTNTVGYYGQYGASDSLLTFSSDGTGTTTIGQDYSNNKAFSISHSNSLGTNEAAVFLLNGRIGFGTSSPWGVFNIASTSFDDTAPVFSIATTSSLFDVFSTTTVQTLVSNTLTKWFKPIGVRIGIGLNNYFGGPFLDELTLNGILNTGDWKEYNCVGAPGIATALTADANNVCGDFEYQVDSLGTFGQASGTNAAQIYHTGLTANSGAGLFIGSTTSIYPATSTPRLEASVSLTPFSSTLQAATTTRYIGFVNITPGGSTFETAPTAGCYFTASSTQANWWAVCQTSGANITMVNTGLSSTTAGSSYSEYYRFRIDMDANQAKFYTQSSTTPMSLLTTMSGANYPGTTILAPGAYLAKDATTGQVSKMVLKYLKVMLNNANTWK